MILIDMHVHSTFSDGTFSVRAIAAAAKRRHLSLLSLTDHDTTAGLASFKTACAELDVASLPGIELSAAAPYTLHILGYRFNSGDVPLNERLEYVRRMRDERNEKICANLRRLGFDVTVDEARKISGGEVVARPHIARLMVQKGFAGSYAEAFGKYIGDGGSAYVPRVRLTAEECISLITGAGGLPVLAHPYQTGLEGEELEKLVKRLREAGLWGIEAVYSSHSAEQIYAYLALADKFDLYPTAGSDFHGGNSPGIDLGMPVSEDFLPWARLGIKM